MEDGQGDDPRTFQTTHWSVVLSAGGPTTDSSANALSRLCESYYYPVYAFIRKRGNKPEDAEDLTQAFFERLLEKSTLTHADPNRGKFRSFLMTSVTNFLHSDFEKRSAQKRGGGAYPLSLDYDHAEALFTSMPSEEWGPEKTFDREWARMLVARVITLLREEFAQANKSPLFDHLERHLWSDSDAIPYPELAKQLDVSLSAVKVSAYRLRARFRRLVTEEIAATVHGSEGIDEEWQFLMESFG